MSSPFSQYTVNSLILDGATNEEKLKIKCLYTHSDSTATILKHEGNIREWDILVKIISDTIQPKFLIEDISYQWWVWWIEPMTKLKIRNTNAKFSSARTIHAQYYSEGNQTINNNPSPIDLITLIAEKEIEHKKEIIALLKEYEKTKDKNKLTEIVGFVANSTQILSYLQTLFS